MANKQQKQLKKLGLSSRNNGANTVISAINHGKFAFMKPDAAAIHNRNSGKRTWKVSKKHPSNNVKK